MNNVKQLFKYSLFLMAVTSFAGILNCIEANENLVEQVDENFENPIVIQNNSILPVSQMPKAKIVRTIRVITTAYSSDVWQTDSTPFITANGTYVRDGIVANNLLPFGTRIRLPEIYGDKIFVVEDRMHSRKGYYHVDIWQSTYTEAKDYGAKRTYIEVLEN
jgi:3D (Asp-Asp-Asp) domain-containing protein